MGKTEQTEQNVWEFIKKYQMIQEGDRLIAGISGGADSVCLFYLLRKLQERMNVWFMAVHVNHCLRGEEADQDEAFVRALCEQEGIPFCAVRRDVRQLAKERGLSLEEAGRAARYEAFEEICVRERAHRIVLAHHQDDLAETMIHHLARGTGLAGLCSLRPLQGSRIRPLLCLGRQEIEEYLQRRGVRWQTDGTNLTDNQTRNKIRHHVVSYLCEEINPKTALHMAETAEELYETEEYLCRLAREKSRRLIRRAEDRGELSEALRQEPGVLRRRIIKEEIQRVAQGGRDIERVHVEAVDALWEKQVGRQVRLPRNVEAVRRYEGIVIRKKEKDDTASFAKDSTVRTAMSSLEEGTVRKAMLSPEEGTVGTAMLSPEEGTVGTAMPSPETGDAAVSVPLNPGEEEKRADIGTVSVHYRVLFGNFPRIEEKKYTKWLDYDKIKNNLLIRHRQAGDRIEVLASGGGKKLKDYLIDRKIPREERDELWLVADGSEILWIIGDRISESYKVTAATRRVLEIRAEQNGAGSKRPGLL